MPEPSPSSRVIRFGLFEADLHGGELRKQGLRVRLQERPFEVLAILLERPNRVVTREEFRTRLWPADTFVDFDHSLNTSITKLRFALDDQADNPRFIATVGRRGYRFIAPVDGMPSVTPARPISAGGGSGAVAGAAAAPAESPSTSAIAAAPRPAEPDAGGRAKRWFYLAAVTALLCLGGLLAYRVLVVPAHKGEGAGNDRSSNPSLRPRRSVAVLGFRNLSKRPDEAWLSTALAEMLNTELAAGEQLRMVSTEEVARVEADFPLTEADSLSPETLAKLRRSLETDIVISGSYTVVGEKVGQRIRVDLRLQDAVAGETIAEVATTGTEADLFELVSRAGAQLRERLGVEAPSAAEAASVRASAPSNPEAARFYARGLARLRAFDPLLARDLLREAVAAEPDYPLSHSALALAWSELGYDSKAAEEAQRAINLSRKLSREEQLAVEGSYGVVTKDWAKAVKSYRTLFALFPDNLDYGLHLVQAQVSAANAPDAQMTLDNLHKLPSPVSDDPRIDLAEVGIAWLHADAKRVLAAASRAAAKSEAQGARLLLARARRAQGAAWRRLGNNAQALPNYDDAKQLYTAAGDRAGAAGILRDVGDTTAEQGDYPSALKLYRQSLAVAREIGNKDSEAADLNNIAVVFENQRDFAAARKMYENALVLYREVDDKSQATISLGNVGEVLFYQGDLSGAERRYREAIDSVRQIGDTDTEAWLLSNMALLLETRGDLTGAKSTFEQALSLWGESDPHAASATIVQLGEVQLAQDDLPAARKTLEKALAMRQKLGEKESIAESRLALAALLLEEGKPADAESSAREAGQEFQAEKIPDLEATACALEARSQLEQGRSRFPDAQKAAALAVLLSAKSQEPMIRLFVAIIAARVQASVNAASPTRQQASSQALQKLQSVLNEARKSGFLGLAFAAQLAMGEIEIQSGSADAGRTTLASLQEAAHTKGYSLIARKAGAAINTTQARSGSGGF